MLLLESVETQVLEKLNALVVVINKYGNPVYVSQSACNLLGQPQANLLGNNWWINSRIDNEASFDIKSKITKLFEHQQISSYEFTHELNTINGLSKWIKWKFSYFNSESIIAIGEDITERKLNEERLEKINKTLAEKNNAIIDSLKYAKRVQTSILQDLEFAKTIFNNCFIYYKPKDIVSGDFYYFHHDNEFKYLINIDCTGHGVPGALMSIIANSIIREVLTSTKLKSASAILYAIDESLFKFLNKNYHNNGQIYDGMDVSVIMVNKKSNRLHYAGANQNAYLVRNNEVITLKASRYPIGYINDIEKVFYEQILILNTNDVLYLSSDGFADQFGGENGKKLNKRNFIELLKTASMLNINEQAAYFDYHLNNWKQQLEQTDDIVVIGLKF
ncbi:MAG: SpoIIE family protein phosphatase [Bacteroidetes bacterium]|nr:SpoIIE family protein phosphatase [Bacteroidota bacterium]